MRRSNRQVKRKKYTEDLDIKITDDEDEAGEDVNVTTIAAVPSGRTQSTGPQLQEIDVDGHSSMQFFVVSFLFPFLEDKNFLAGFAVLSTNNLT